MRTHYLYLIFLLSFSFNACNDSFLERVPLDELTDETYWQTEIHLESAANACIDYLRTKERTVDMEFLGDNVYRERSSNYKTIGSGNFTSDISTINSEWDYNYNGIRCSNHFLENYQRAEKVAESIRERYAAEARFMRAYCYVYLVNFFGDVPLITKTLDINDEALYGQRNNKEEVVDWIIDELYASAENLKAASDITSAEIGRPTKEAAWALISRVALYNERWDDAVAAAELVFDSDYHQLYNNGNPSTSYNELFTHTARASRNSNNKEYILMRVYNKDLSIAHNLSRELQVPNEEVRYAPTRSLMDAYLCNGLPIAISESEYRENTYEAVFENRDPRLAQTVLKPGASWGGYPGNTIFEKAKFSNSATSCRTTTGWYFTKFVEIPCVALYKKDDNDIPLIRYAEVLLNWIEAKYMRGDLISQADIDNSVNLLRTRVGCELMNLLKLENYQLNLLDEIRRERRVELALEGERYFDILRWKQGYLLAEDMKGMRKSNVPPDQYQYVMDIPTDKEGNLIKMTGRTFVDPKNYLWPVPFTQTQRNPNLLPNNTGWE